MRKHPHLSAININTKAKATLNVVFDRINFTLISDVDGILSLEMLLGAFPQRTGPDAGAKFLLTHAVRQFFISSGDERNSSTVPASGRKPVGLPFSKNWALEYHGGRPLG